VGSGNQLQVAGCRLQVEFSRQSTLSSEQWKTIIEKEIY
jgi:hypothetical protein